MVEQYMRSLKLGAMAKRKSLIITSNLGFSQWNTVFGDSRLTAALVDRLVHYSHIVIFFGDSRLTQSIMRQRR